MKITDYIKNNELERNWKDKDNEIERKLKEYPDHPKSPKFGDLGGYTISIIDTLESIYINFKEEHNEKIKEIFELIDIDTLIRPKLLENVSHTERNLIKKTFGTEFNTVEYNELLNDISNYLEFNKKITEIQNKQTLIEQRYNLVEQKDPIMTNYSTLVDKKFSTVGEIKVQSKVKGEIKPCLEGYSTIDSYMKAGDYRLCSVETLELNDKENGLIQNRKTFEKRCYILFASNKCIVLENENYDLNNLLENFTDIKLIDNCVKTPFKEILHKRTFDSFTECQSMYNTLKSTLPKETIDTVIENKITNYINWNYSVTEDVKDKIKVLELYNLCKKECNCSIDSRQFSKILLKLNLKKKRYQDGIYYYGLKKFDSQTNMTDIKSKLFDGFLQERPPLKSDEHVNLLDKMQKERNEL
jgi:hypothetical protein